MAGQNWTLNSGPKFSGIYDWNMAPNSGMLSSTYPELSSKYADFFGVDVTPNENQKKCNGTWLNEMLYVYEGSSKDEELHTEMKRLTDSFGKTPGLLGSWHVTAPVILHLDHWWDYIKTTRTLDLIDNSAFSARNTTLDTRVVGSISVKLDKADLMASKLVSNARELFSNHHGGSAGTVYHDIPGQFCQDRPVFNTTALGRAFHDAEFHLIMGEAMRLDNQQWWYELGDGAYFGESAFEMYDWKQRYWGDHYENLLAVKRQYDPANLFWCHNCVGSDLKESDVLLV